MPETLIVFAAHEKPEKTSMIFIININRIWPGQDITWPNICQKIPIRENKNPQIVKKVMAGKIKTFVKGATKESWPKL